MFRTMSRSTSDEPIPPPAEQQEPQPAATRSTRHVEDSDEWNVDQFRDISKMPLHNMQKNLSYIKRKCKAQLDALNAMRGREEVDKEQYAEVVKAFVAAELELTERRAFDAAKCIIEMENDTGMLQTKGNDTESINSWTVEHFVARKKETGSARYQRREFAIFINEETIRHYKGVNGENTNLSSNSDPHVWLQLLHSVYMSLIMECTENTRMRQQRSDSSDVRNFIFMREAEGPSFIQALQTAAADATEQHRVRPPEMEAVALFPGVSDTDLGAAAANSFSFDAGDGYKLKYREAYLSNRNTQVNEKMRNMAPKNSMVNEETNKFFNEDIAPKTYARWGEIELNLHGSTHFIRFLRAPKKTNYVMVYPFYGIAKPGNETQDFRNKSYNVYSLFPYAVKTPWIPGRTAVARLSEVDVMVEAMQTIKVLRDSEVDYDETTKRDYIELKDNEEVKDLIKHGKPMKDKVRVYYSVQDEYFGQWAVWFVYYESQIIGVQLYYPSLAMLHANKQYRRREIFNVNGTPHRHWTSVPRTYHSVNAIEWPSINVQVMSRWYLMAGLNGTYEPVYNDDTGWTWKNTRSQMWLGTVSMTAEGAIVLIPKNEGQNTQPRMWAFYSNQRAFAWVNTITPLNVTRRWTNFSHIQDRNTVRININPVMLPVSIGNAQTAKGPAPHTTPDVHLGAVMESLGEIRRALNHAALLKNQPAEL